MWYKTSQLINLCLWAVIAGVGIFFNPPVLFYAGAAGVFLLAAVLVNEVFRQNFSMLKYLLCALTIVAMAVLLFIALQMFDTSGTVRFIVLTVAGLTTFYTVIYILFKGPQDAVPCGPGGLTDAGKKIHKGGQPKVLDTSSIIDGRIGDICETGFLEGVFIVPKFVIEELQLIADSSDPMKRAKGRRGLDILKDMQSSSRIMVQISDIDYPNLTGVDAKLLAIGQELDAVVVTNDYNLNKIAALKNISVLNINDLANCVKTVMIPGEERRVTIVKAGKDQNQGLAYLEDGTMIVVENGRNRIHKTVTIVVTSVLQTSAGRMIFARIK